MEIYSSKVKFLLAKTRNPFFSKRIWLLSRCRWYKQNLDIIGFSIELLNYLTKRCFPVWYRLGMGFQKKENSNLPQQSLKTYMLVDSKIFEKNNVIQINKMILKSRKRNYIS